MSRSLQAIHRALVREPASFVTRSHNRTVANCGFDRIRRTNVLLVLCNVGFAFATLWEPNRSAHFLDKREGQRYYPLAESVVASS